MNPAKHAFLLDKSQSARIISKIENIVSNTIPGMIFVIHCGKKLAQISGDKKLAIAA